MNNKNITNKKILFPVLFLGIFFAFSAKGMENECDPEVIGLDRGDKFSVIKEGDLIIYEFEYFLDPHNFLCPSSKIILESKKNIKTGKLHYEKCLYVPRHCKKTFELREKQVGLSSDEIEFLKKKTEKYAKIALEKALLKDENEKRLDFEFGCKDDEIFTKKDEVFSKKTEGEELENNFKTSKKNLRLRLPNDLEGKDVETTETMKKTESLRYSKILEIRKQAFISDQICSFCGDLLVWSPDYIGCALCLKAFYCDKICQDIDHEYRHKFECLKSIEEEKEAKKFDKFSQDKN